MPACRRLDEVGGQTEIGRVKNLPGLYCDWKLFTTQADFDKVGLHAWNARAEPLDHDLHDGTATSVMRLAAGSRVM